MPDFDRDVRKPLDVTKVAVVAHYARFFSLAQFAALSTEILQARGEPQPLLHGWAGLIMPVDQTTAQDCFFDLVDFAKRQWKEQYHNIKGIDHSHEEEATASDVKDFPFARSRQHTQSREGVHRDFDVRKGRAREENVLLFNNRWNVGLVDSMAIDLGVPPITVVNVVVDGSGNDMATGLRIQHAREGRPDGTMAGIEATNGGYSRQMPNVEWGGSTASSCSSQPSRTSSSGSIDNGYLCRACQHS
eukprot:s750_g13.t1